MIYLGNDEPSVDRIGGKGANLARLHQLGFCVPSWYAVTTEGFRVALREAGVVEDIRSRLADVPSSDEHALQAVAADLQEIVLRIPLPQEVRECIASRQGDSTDDSPFVSVRSSAVDEDTRGGSFAGLHDSFLFLRGEEAVSRAIQKVWASAFNERALAYRVAQGLTVDDIVMAVLVQDMVEATTSGVMFTVNPTTQNVHEVVISSLYGAGEGLVSAGLDADTFTVQKRGRSLVAQLVGKDTQLVFDQEQGHGLISVPVAKPQREVASLTDSQVLQVAEAGLVVEKHYRRPQDIEFSFDADGTLFLLQTRPVTTVDEVGPAAGHGIVWDNSNIIESYSGVTSPMTFSFIRRAYTIVYHCFSQVMGVSPKVVQANHGTFSNMLGLFRGEVYYNLGNWYRLVQLFPGFNYNKGFMESMMGVQTPSDVADEQSASVWRKYFVELPALVRLVVRSAWNFLRIRRLVDEFDRHFQQHVARWSALDFDDLPPHELMHIYDEMEEELLWKWKAPIINDFFVMIFYGTLRKLCASWGGDVSGTLQNDLLCGEGGIESTEPTRLLMELAATANKNVALRALILDGDPERLVEQIPSDPRFAEFSAEMDAYLDRYGFRCMQELKLEEPSLRDRPQFVYQILRNYLAMGDTSGGADSANKKEQEIRGDAENRVEEALGKAWGTFWKRPVFASVLKNARLGVKNRENMRFARTKIYGVLREILCALGRQWVVEGLLDEADDIFYLTIDEVWDFIKGTAVTTNLRTLAKLRRTEFNAYRQEPDASPDDRFETFGMAYHKNNFCEPIPQMESPEDGTLRGTGCCPGELEGPVKVLLSPSDDMQLSGEILVAGRTDPGWVPLYRSVSGLLIERGSILSHSAIVAREMGIPAIVGIAGLTTTLQSGDRVRMDGASGSVTILDGTSLPDSTEPPTGVPAEKTPSSS